METRSIQNIYVPWNGADSVEWRNTRSLLAYNKNRLIVAPRKLRAYSQWAGARIRRIINNGKGGQATEPEGNQLIDNMVLTDHSFVI